MTDRTSPQHDAVVSIDRWLPDESSYENGYYPEGAREKAVYFSPDDVGGLPLRPGWRYLFKKSRNWAPWQFWMEIIAYRVGQVIDVTVPPAYVGMRHGEGPGEETYGALIEWFYGDDERYIEGSRLVAPLTSGFDYKVGRPHDLLTLLDTPLLTTGPNADKNRRDLILHWARVLTFDTLIGNVDRHPDNWGVVLSRDVAGAFVRLRMSPAFDNGTALSYEQPEGHFDRFADPDYVTRYLTRPKKARHHMEWGGAERADLDFFQFMRRFVCEFPETRAEVLRRTRFTGPDLRAVTEPLVGIPCASGSRLTRKRLDFTVELMLRRRDLLLTALGEG